MYNNYDLHIKILLNIILINMFLLYDILIQSILFNKFTFPLTRYCINSGLYTLSEFEIAAALIAPKILAYYIRDMARYPLILLCFANVKHNHFLAQSVR